MDLSSSISLPRVGKRKEKMFKCKHCVHISQSKDDLWAHARSHIAAEQMLSCDKCNFVTEYKHHLEYHSRNHSGIKPFMCKKCAYACVNKSLLDAHLKSHDSAKPFRCADCDYATKYRDSLTLHLKKYSHGSGTEEPCTKKRRDEETKKPPCELEQSSA